MFDPFWFRDPEALISYLVASVAVFLVMRGHPISLAVIVAVYLFWPHILKRVRKSFLDWRVQSSRDVSRRKAGFEYCPECGATLQADPDKKGFKHHVCPDCRGRWCEGSAMTARLGALKEPLSPWVESPAEPGAESPLCPHCGAAMRRGLFPPKNILAFSCADCDGCWVSHREWATIEIALL